MDKSIYTAMVGAKSVLHAQAVTSHNLANLSTTGFRAELATFGWQNIGDEAATVRAIGTAATTGFNTTVGPMVSTGRDLDVAIQGPGWFAVQAEDGTEAYTRAGNFRLDPTGELQTPSGRAVLGDGGPVVLPPHSSLTIGSNGEITVVPLGQGPEAPAIIGRLKLVNPPVNSLSRGGDGLFRLTDGGIAASDPTVEIGTGMLEGSNVNAAQALVSMIEISRHFDMQMRAIRGIEENANQTANLLSLR
jgi:flagellar basal-body rod protein FlgF